MENPVTDYQWLLARLESANTNKLEMIAWCAARDRHYKTNENFKMIMNNCDANINFFISKMAEIEEKYPALIGNLKAELLKNK